MKLKVAAPMLLAPVIGLVIGVQMFRSFDPVDTDAHTSAGAPNARHQAAPAFGAAWDDLQALMNADAAGTGRAAFDAALRQRAGAGRAQALQSAFTHWLLAAPAEALGHIGAIPAAERKRVITAAMAALAQRSPASIDRHLAALGKDDLDLGVVIAAMAGSHPDQAVAWIGQHPHYDADGALTAAILPGLLRGNLPLAAAAVSAMNERASIALIEQVTAAYARRDPAQAYAWVTRMIASRPDISPQRLLDDASAAIAAASPDAAAQFMGKSDDPAVRTSLMNELANRKAQEDVASAWQWLDQYSADPAYAEVALNMLYRWSYARPQDVAQLLPRVANPALQASAAAHLARYWQQRDPSGYQQWLASLPPGALRSAAIITD
jgi:hypothetical protein